MMAVYVQIASGFDGQIEQAMAGERRQHVVEEADAGIDCSVTTAVEVHADAEIGLVCRAGDFGYSRHGLTVRA
jgi:hypothetical protein